MRWTAFLVFSAITLHAIAQEETELDKRNGFKDIQMATPVDSITGAAFKKDISEKNRPPLKLYEVHGPDYKTIGDIPIDKIQIKAYKGLVYTISVVTDKDPRLMKGLQSALGPPEFNVRDKNYVWTGKNLTLTFSSYSKNKLEMLYRSYKVAKIMKDDQEKKIEKIADDF